METLKINYIDYWHGMKKDSFYFTEIMKKHYDVVIENDLNKCDILFTGPFGNQKVMEHPFKLYYTGENRRDDFVNNKYCFSYNYNNHPNHYTLPIYYTTTNFKRIKQENRIMTPRTKFASFLFSNGGVKVRNEIFKSLSDYKRVDSGGRFANNIGGPVPPLQTIPWQSQYKFSLSCENVIAPGFITEKIVHGYHAGSIPIYWGTETIREELNTKSFINVSEFVNMKELIEYIIEVDNNDQLYQDILNQPLLVNNEYNPDYTEDAIALKIKELFEQSKK